MIFLAADNEPTMFIMLTDQDINDMRGGRTKFVDEYATKGRLFDKVIISVHKNHSEIEEMIRQAGHGDLLKGMPSPKPKATLVTCKGCRGIMEAYLLLDEKCIACWRELARS